MTAFFVLLAQAMIIEARNVEAQIYKYGLNTKRFSRAEKISALIPVISRYH